MREHRVPRLGLLAPLALVACAPAQPGADRVLLDFEQPLQPAQITTVDATALRILSDGEPLLRVETGHRRDWPSVTLRPLTGTWDLSENEYVLVTVRNLSDRPMRLFCRVGNHHRNIFPLSVVGDLVLPPHATDTIEVALQRPTAKEHRVLFGMRYYPVLGRGPMEASKVGQVSVFVHKPKEDHVFAIERVVAGGRYQPAPAPKGRLVPFIDRYGQYEHADWPGKTHRDEDLEERRREEAADLKTHPTPAGWNQWGGYEDGPQLEATGAFRVEKYRGRWWLVDPAGRLFWSHGITCVRPNTGVTAITDRDQYFEGLPAADDPLARFFSQRTTAPFGYYHNRDHQVFDFTSANLMRKYGSTWRSEFTDVSHRRLRSWGINTIGNFSSPDVYLRQRTAYTVGVVYDSPVLEGSEGHWHKFPDVFDPEFRPTLMRTLNSQHRLTARDPWCIGYFVNNEMSWGGPIYLALATLRSPPTQAAKLTFVEDLRQKYESIATLNNAWETAHESWDALLASTQPPEARGAVDDLLAFNLRTTQHYFQTCKAALSEFAPDRLYLGCRFTPNPAAVLVRAAAESCDVISYNLYWRDLRGLRLPEGVDRPVMIGEFDFVALDRGHFDLGIQYVPTQARRAVGYERYVQSGLVDDAVVGTHWYQYFDMPATGVPNGTGMQSGFLDIVDTPYPEIIEASRRMAARLYTERLRQH